MVREPKTSLAVVLLALLFTLAVATVDYVAMSPDGRWVILFVLPVVWLALWSAEDDRLPLILMAFIVTGLIVFGGISAAFRMADSCFPGRAQVIGVLWITVGLALLRKRTRSTYKWINLIGR